MNYYRTLRAL